MKSIILAITLTAFAAGAFAGEACCPKEKAAKNQAACAGKDKSACAVKNAATCEKGKGTCPAGATAGKKAQSPKDAGKS